MEYIAVFAVVIQLYSDQQHVMFISVPAVVYNAENLANPAMCIILKLCIRIITPYLPYLQLLMLYNFTQKQP